jgi:VWFA-related protein
MRARFSLFLLTLAAAAILVTLRPAAQQRSVETFRSVRELLTVDASVQDATGRPVTDLQPSDFTVRIDGEARRVLIAHVFGTDAGRLASADAAPVPRFARNVDAPSGRLVMFVIDRASIRNGSEKAMIETAAKMIDALSPADAVGAVGLPVGGIDLTRNHAAVADAIRRMSGTAPDPGWQHQLSWDEALAYDRTDRNTIAHVLERECPKIRKDGSDSTPNECALEVTSQARDMLPIGRAHAQAALKGIVDAIGRLGTLRAPRHLILMSGGFPFDPEILSEYREVATQAAKAHVALFVVHLDQTAFDASDRGHFGDVFGGRDYAEGLGNIAASSGGSFFQGVGRAAGAFDRIASEINYFYELGVESTASDANGKSHKIEVTVDRPGVHVRAPAATIVAVPARPAAGEAVATALAEPTDVVELPFEVATYVTHSSDLDKVRVMVSAAVSDDTRPAEWGYVILDGAKVVTSSRSQVDPSSALPWAATASVEIPPGRYRLRTAVIGADGREGTLEIPFAAGLRSAGNIQASDLMVGAVTDGRLLPRARVRQDEAGVAMIELSSAEPLGDTTGQVQLTRAGTANAALTFPLKLRVREDDKSIVVAEGPLDSSSLAPGIYTASVVLARAGAPMARVSRVLEIVAGAAVAAAPPSRPTPVASRSPELDGVLQHLGDYVSQYGQQASVIVGVEHYMQHYKNSPVGQPSVRKTTAEYALVKTAGTAEWAGFRDVIEVDGKPVPDRQDRLKMLFKAGTPDLSEARRIADESARFNIGPTRRNFNDPMSALFFMLPGSQPRFVFTRKGDAKAAGGDAWEIDFEEKSRPTIIQTSEGHDVPSRGTLWIVPADGTVVRTKLVLSGFAGPGSRSTLDVTYARDPRLGLWLPVTMSEEYAGAIRIVSIGRVTRTSVNDQPLVTASATYSDFKRFETGATIK